MHKVISLFICSFVLSIFTLSAQDTSMHHKHAAPAHQSHQDDHMQHHPPHPNEHEPISVMGAHQHHKGAWMFSYRFMPMRMEGNLSTSERIGNEAIFQDYLVAPQRMQTHMHMLGIMYAPTNYITLMAMGNFQSKQMELKTRSGIDFITESMGIGDIKISALINVFQKRNHSFHLNLGVSLPTGDIDQKDATPMASEAQLAYPMQLGSGTVDPLFGGTYLMRSMNFFFGIQPLYQFRTGQNTNNYSLGNKFQCATWLALKSSKYLSFSLSGHFIHQASIKGADAKLNPNMMPLFDTDNSGRIQANLGLGVNFYIPEGSLQDLGIGADLMLPIYQKVEGIQMNKQWMFTIGIEYIVGH